MATYTLFNQGAVTGSGGGGGVITGTYGVQFSVSSSAVANGVWFYSPPGSTAALPDVIGLFNTTSNLVVWFSPPVWSGVVGSGWIFAAFPAPVWLTASTAYVAALHQPFSGPNWNTTDATYWSSGAGSGGITSGILSAPNNATAVHGQGIYTAGTSIEAPVTGQSGANIWVDVQVSDAPSNLYTVFQQQAVTVPSVNDNSQYTFGMEFNSSVPATATAVWWFSPYFTNAAQELPETIAVFNVGSQTVVHSEAASWSGPQGSGWVRAAFVSPVSLSSGTNYKVGVLKTGTGNNWYAAFSHYWDSGPGAGGITNGPLSALNNGSSDGGQDTFNVGSSLTYPTSSFNAANYGVDVEITVASSVPSGQLGQPGLGSPRKNLRKRAFWRGVTPTGVNAIPPRGTVPPRVFVARRTASRVAWRGVTPVGANAVITHHDPLNITLASMEFMWQTGPVELGWQTGPMSLGWQTGPMGTW